MPHGGNFGSSSRAKDEKRREGREKREGEDRRRKDRTSARHSFIQPTASLGTDDNAFVSGKKRDFLVSLSSSPWRLIRIENGRRCIIVLS